MWKSGYYRHYKGGEYAALFAAKHTEFENVWLIIYKAVGKDGPFYARPMEHFFGKIENSDIQRFEFIRDFAEGDKEKIFGIEGWDLR